MPTTKPKDTVRLIGDAVNSHIHKIRARLSRRTFSRAGLLMLLRSFVILVAVATAVVVIASGFTFLGDTALLRYGLGIPLSLPGALVGGYLAVALGDRVIGRRSMIPLAILSILAALSPSFIGIEDTEALFVILGGLLAQFTLQIKDSRRISRLHWIPIVVILWLAFASATWNPTVSYISNEPTGGGWHLDTIAMLKMFYLMKQGMGYYEAYYTGFATNAGEDLSTYMKGHVGSYLGQRGPFLLEFWQIFPNAPAVYLVYLLLSTLAIACGYFAFSKRSKSAGLIASVFLVPYFTLGLGQPVLFWLEWDFWGALFGIISLALYLRNHRSSAALPALLAFMCKETLAGIMLAGLIATLLRRKRRELLVWGSSLIVLFAYYALHYTMVWGFGTFAMKPANWTQGGSKFVVDVLQFALPWLPVSWYVPLVGFAILGALAMETKVLKVYAFACAILPLSALLYFGKKWDEYWGAAIIPFMLIICAYGLTRFAAGSDKPTIANEPSTATSV